MKFSFTPERIMMMLSKERLQKLEKIWEDYPDGLELPLFTQLMIDSIECQSEEEKYELVHGALKLFSEIDINGDAHMEWDEFMQYIIDAVLENSLSSGGDDNKKQSVLELIQQMKANRFQRFYMAFQPVDKAMYSAKTQMVYTFERHTKEIKFYTKDLRFKEKFKVPLRIEGFILGIDYSDYHLTFGATASDGQLHFFLSTSKGIRYHKGFPTPGIQNKLWYLPKHKQWISAGRDHHLHLWDPFKVEPHLDSINLNQEMHSDDIMDVCEIDVPFCIATCSMDKRIVLYSIQEREVIRIIEGDHIKGVKKLSYNGKFGGHLISVGHEIYANVWGPESLISEILIGKLKGHTKPIIDTKFIGKTPFNITIDEKNSIRIWDIRSMMCLQLVKGRVQTAAQGLCCIENNIFWIYGKRFIQFDTYSVDEGGDDQQQDTSHEIYPKWAELNTYYMSIVVVNKNEVKLYDTSTGQLMKIHSNLVDIAQKQEITQFKLDLRHRKCYIGDTFGSIKVYNIINGVILKTFTEDEDDEEEEEPDEDALSDSSEDRSSSSRGFQAKDGKADLEQQHMKEITGMQLIWEEDYIMMVATDHKYIYVYDEEDTEESELLRKLTGVHKEEITILKYDDYLSLLATGSVDGEIAIWDFEMSKLEALIVGHTGDITGIEFLSPYPLMLTSSMDCTVCLWGVRPAPIKYKYVCINRFTNMSWNLQKDQETPVTKIAIQMREGKGIQRHKRIKDGIMNASRFGSFNLGIIVAAIQSKIRRSLVDETEKTGGKHKEALLAEIGSGLQSGQNQSPAEFLGQSSQQRYFSNYLQQLIDVVDYENTINEERERQFVYVADELGYLKVWDLSYIIQRLNVKKAPNYPKTKVSFNPKRKENIDYSNHMISIRLEEVKAHTECIVALNAMDTDQGGLISCSLDRKVRIWSANLDMHGSLDQRTERRDAKWGFPQEFKRKQKENEITQVKELLADVEIDANDKNLIFKDVEPEASKNATAKEEKFYISKKKVEKQIQHLPKSERTDETGETNKEPHIGADYVPFGGLLENIERKIQEFDYTILKVQQEQSQRVYHGFAKELEKVIDNKSHQSRGDLYSKSGSKHHKLTETHESRGGQYTTEFNESSQILKRKTTKLTNMTHADISYVSLKKTEASKHQLETLIDHSLEREKSKLIQYKDAPKIRDKILGLSNNKSKSSFATPMRYRKNFNIESTISNYRVDDDKFMEHKITAGIKLPPMNISPKHRNYSLENTSAKGTATHTILADIQNERGYSSVQRGKSRVQLNKTIAQPGLPRNFITGDGEATHINTDLMIMDEGSGVVSDFQGRKDKYYGQKSVLKAIFTQETEKLQQQRFQLKMKMKIPKYPRMATQQMD